VVDFIKERMEKMAMNRICEDLLENCRIPVNPATGLGNDNMTVIISKFR